MNRSSGQPQPMRRSIRWLLPALFLLVCGLTVWFLHLFTVENGSMVYIDWTESAHIGEDGSEEPFDTTVIADTTELEGTFRFVGTLPEGLPDGELLFETSGLSITLELDGVEIWSSSSTTVAGTLGMAQGTVPLPAGTTGELVATCTIVDGSNTLFPPLVRFMPEGFEEMQSIALANLSAFPTGASALAFVLVVGLFLMSCGLAKPDWSLVPLALAAAGLTVYLVSPGAFFLPEAVSQILSRREIGLVTVALLIVYLAMNRKRQFWRLFGLATAWSAAGLAAWDLVSKLTDGYLAYFLEEELSALTTGYYGNLLYWTVLWLTVVCALISAYGVAHSFADQQAREQGLALKNQMTAEGYRTLKAKVRETAELRHDLKNRLIALDALYQKGDYPGMKALLDEMRAVGDGQVQTSFTDNAAVNIVLQDAAVRARRGGIDFEVQTLLPAELGIPEQDLCSLLMNMLDNALEACLAVKPPERRFIKLRIKVVRGFLAIHCENSFAGTLVTDEEGNIATSKADDVSHGFGLRQMERVATSYGSTLEISHSDEEGVFTVQTALKLPETACEEEDSGKGAPHA